jgi:hypothetical protein
MMDRSAKVVLLVCTLVLYACSAEQDGPVAIQTQPPTIRNCLLMPVYGMLVADTTWGLAIVVRDDAGNPHRVGVVWPNGYSAHRDEGTVYLHDPDGKVVAHEGDGVAFDGNRNSDPLYPCDDVKLGPASLDPEAS